MNYFTVEQIKENLPAVAVSIANQERIYCQVGGRKEKFAKVYTPSGNFEFSWQSVTDAVNMDRALII